MNRKLSHCVVLSAFAVCAASADTLPSGYTELEYIYMEGGAANQSSATHYIDTGVVPSGNWTISASFASTNTTGASGVYSCLFCSRSDGNANPLALWPFIGSSGHEGESRIDIGSRNTPGYLFQSGPATFQPCVKHLVEIKESSSGNLAGYIDRDRKTLEIAQFDSSVCPLVLFSVYTGSSDGSYSNVKYSFEGWFYSFKATDSAGVVRLDIVPARRDSDSAVGVYDKVSDTFFTNQGTGSFVAGPVKTAVTYTAVEYLQSDGNQYIDTQFILNNTHAATLDFQPTVLPTVNGGTDPNGTQSLFGCRNGAASKNIAFFIDINGLGIDFKNSSSADYRLSSYALSTSTRYAAAAAAGTRYVCNKSTAEATAQANLWSGSFTCDGTAYLFAANDQSSSGAPLWNKAKMKFFGGTVVASDGTLLCKFVPCLRNGTEPGVYDPVRDLFLANIGSGSFTYGAATGVVYGGAATSPSAATIDPTNYECSMTITPVAGSVSTTLSNFPLLVRLSAARQIGFNPADCGTNGADLRFALSDGTLLSHEIDTWSTTGESLVWVNVPAFSSATQIVAYWGVKDASAAPAVTASDTWPDFVAVYHLGEGAATAHDSSGNGYDARNAASVTAGSSPKVGGCALVSNLFTADVTSLTDPTAAKPLADRSVVTFSSWVAIDSINTSSSANAQNARLELARKYSTWDSGAGGFSCRYFADNAYTSGSHTAKPLFGIAEPSGNGAKNGVHNWNTVQGADTGTWLYLTCVVDGTTVAKYINGVLATGADLNGSNTQNPRDISHSILGPDIAPLQFGAREDGSGGTHAGVMRGRMDEMRIRSGAASADWIAADFAQQNADAFLTYGPVSGAEAPPFVVEPIAAQTVSSPLELVAGVTPSVTVTDGTTSAVLAEGTDYTVAYTGNDTVGPAYAIVTGIGKYDGYAVSVPFVISGVTIYYAVSGGNDDSGSSSISGNGSPAGWSTTKGGMKAVNGITAANAIYTIWENRWMRTPYASGYATPATSAIVVEQDCVWTLGVKMTGQTLTLSNVVVRSGGAVNVIPINDDGKIQNNTFAGNFMLEEGATLRLDARQNPGAIKQGILSASVTGRGAVVLPSSADTIAYDGVLENKITGDISGFTGDIGTWDGNNLAAVSLELVNAASIPGDPQPEEVAYVVVTNGATLKIDNSWTSPTNRIWILGDGATPTINVPSGKTVTVEGNLVGSVGFNKTGTGTLVLKGASPDFSGTVTISAGEVRLAGKAAQLSAAPRITWVENGGTYVVASLTVYPVADQTVYDLATLAAGIRPSVTVSNLEDMVELVLGTDYTVAYANNTAYGQATATVTGVGHYAGTVRDVTFNIHLVKQITADYALSADEDWTAFESIDVASGAVIDLKGHDLTISGLDGAGEITDSVGGGSLIFNVPAVFASGYEAAITGVSLTGKLKLVKTGAGLLKAAKTGQTYTGGNDILGGVLRVAIGAGSNMNDASPLGSNSSSAHNSVYLGPNGTLDPAGTAVWGYHDLTLAGGTVSNTVAGVNISYGVFNPSTTVTADSTFVTMQTYGWTVPELGGHTIHLRVKSGATLWIGYGTPRAQPGKIVCEGGGILRTFGQGASLDSIDLEVRSAAFDLGSGPLTVHDYSTRYSSNYGWGSAALKVYGTFAPAAGAYFYGPTMQDGSAIDLSALTGAWNSTSPLTCGGNRVTKFADGASVAILLGSRTPAYGEKIGTWTPEVRPASSVSFTNETYVFRYGNYGIYVDSPRTFNPSFLPDIASARLASDVEAAIEASLSVTNLVTDETLALGTDYTYAYTIDHGVCTVTVTGKGDYAGVSIVRTFTIGEIGFKATDYTYAMDIVPTVGKVTAPLTNFPVLVRLSASKLGAAAYGNCKPDELRFTLDDGTFLAHDIDYWNENGESTVWVNVPELTAETVIRAYWGIKPGREPLARPSDETWTDYVGVWHFSEASGIVRDSSGNGYHSTNDGGGTVSNVNAKVGLARNTSGTALLTGVTDLTSAAAAKRISNVSRFSISGWMLSTETIGDKQWPDLMRKGQWSGNGWFACFEASPTLFDGVGTGSTRTKVTIPTSVYNNWVYLTVVFNDTSCSVYEDGALVEAYEINKVSNSTYELQLANALTGRIDEYRIRNGLQSAAYVSADYATQTDADFLTFGEVKSSGGTVFIMR